MPAYILVDLGLSSKVFRRGLVFQAQLLGADPEVPSVGDVVAEGGRYDHLVASFRPPGFLHQAAATSAEPTMAVGVRLAVDKLVDLLAAEQERRALAPAPAPAPQPPLPFPTPDVLLLSSAGGVGARQIEARLRIAAVLWSHGIRADYLPRCGREASWRALDAAAGDPGDPSAKLLALLSGAPSEDAAEERKGAGIPGEAELRDVAIACGRQGIPLLAMLREDAQAEPELSVCSLAPAAEGAATLEARLAAMAHGAAAQEAAERGAGAAVPLAQLPAHLKGLLGEHPGAERARAGAEGAGAARQRSGSNADAFEGLEVYFADPTVEQTGRKNEAERRYGSARSARGVAARVEELLVSAASGGGAERSAAVVTSPLSYTFLRDVGTAVAKSGVDGQDVKELLRKAKKGLRPFVDALLARITEIVGARENVLLVLYSTPDERFDLCHL